MIKSCRNCRFGDDPYDHCGVDGKNIRVNFWQPCDRYYEYDLGCDLCEQDEFEAIVMSQGADVKGAYLEMKFNEDCI